MRKLELPIAALMVAAAAAFLGVHGSLPASGNQPVGQPVGVISVDVSPGDNSASSVGPIGASASASDTCGDNGPGIIVELVISGIPGGKDIGGWQARIQFDPNVLTFFGHAVADPDSGAQFFMEKAAAQTPFANSHILVSNPQPGGTGLPGVGAVDIGSAVIATPAGANGSGLLARLFFDCVGDGVTSIDITDGTNSFFSDVNLNNHEYARRNGAILGVNVGEEALAGRTPTSATATDAPSTGTDAPSNHTDAPSTGTDAPSTEQDGPAGAIGSPAEPGPQTPAPEEASDGAETSPAGFAGGAAEAGNGGGDDWIIPVIAAASIGGLALIAGAAVYWRRFRRRA